MNMQPVTSSQIKAVGYDGGAQQLAVEFHRSGVYTYNNVPRYVYEGLLAAESVGKFFGAHVKGKFEYQKSGGEQQ